MRKRMQRHEREKNQQQQCDEDLRKMSIDFYKMNGKKKDRDTSSSTKYF